MNQVAKKLQALEASLSAERGPFKLFALFLREDAPDVWDLVVSADWLSSRSSDDLKTVAEKVRKSLGRELITKLSRVVIVDDDNPALRAVASAISVSHGLTEVVNGNFFGLPIRHAFIITAQKPSAA